jgi:hypothetical protein
MATLQAAQGNMMQLEVTMIQAISVHFNIADKVFLIYHCHYLDEI